MNYTRFTNEEKKQAFRKVNGRDFMLAMIKQVNILYSEQPSMVIKRPDVYAEIYNITHRDLDGAHHVISFCRYTEEEVYCDVICQMKGKDCWTSGKLSAHDEFIKQLNASIYGKYDNTHIKELTISYFFAVCSVLLYEDKINIIRATRGGLEFFVKNETNPDFIMAVKFTSYENLNPSAFRSIYLKINKNLREITALSAKEKHTAEDTKELERLAEGLCGNDDVVAFLKALELKGEL